MKKIREQNGVTLIALTITIIVLLIIAAVSITEGMDVIDKAKVETIETNMFTIKSKVKEYAENVDALNWNLEDEPATAGDLSEMETKNREEYTGTYYFNLIDDADGYENYSQWYTDTDNYTYYSLSKEALENMGLEDLWEDDSCLYVIKCPLEDGDTDGLEMDIIYIRGVTYEKNTYYTLLELQDLL